MPIPKPNNETDQEFLDRCMADETMQEYDKDKRLAICEAQIERNIKIVIGAPCSGKNTYVAKHKRDGDMVWDFDKIHSALTDTESHNHQEQIRKYIFLMRETLYKELKNEKELRVWIINSSPLKEVRQKLAQELNAEIIFIQRSQDECLEVAKNERPEQWENFITSYFERLEAPDETEKITIIEVNTKSMENIKKRHIISIEENEETVTIVYEKDTEPPTETDDEEVERAPEDEEEIEEEIEEEEEEELEEEEEEEYNSRNKESVDVWDKKHTSETRYFNLDSRLDTKEGKDIVIGHAAIFNSLSEDLGGFREKINVGAFDGVLDNDVRAYFNHDPNYLLGRTTAGTLRLSVDNEGLRYELDVPNTTAGRDLKENMRLGNITQSSFAFTIGKNGDSWERSEDGADIRVINKVNRLYYVSPVSLPAYPSANDLALANRSNYMDIENTRKKQEQKYEQNALLNLKINLLKIKK